MQGKNSKTSKKTAARRQHIPSKPNLVGRKTFKSAPKREKKAIAKIWHDQGVSYRSMENYLGADFTTICKWSQEEIKPEEVANVQKKYFDEVEAHRRKIMAQALKRIEEIAPEEKDLDKLGRLITNVVLGFDSKNPTTTTNVQVNVGQLADKQREVYGEL